MSARNFTPHPIRPARRAERIASGTARDFGDSPPARVRALSDGVAALVLLDNDPDTGSVTVPFTTGEELDALVTAVLDSTTADLLALWT